MKIKKKQHSRLIRRAYFNMIALQSWVSMVRHYNLLVSYENTYGTWNDANSNCCDAGLFQYSLWKGPSSPVQ